jgi:hypothetical protein
MSPTEDDFWPTEDELTPDAFEEGRRACNDGVHRVNNPYPPETRQFKAWVRGWLRGLED